MNQDQELRQVGESVFARIREAFPALIANVDSKHPHVQINVSIPEQPGLAFQVDLNLQGDELHLSAGAFWLEWFPCTNAAVREAYFEAVSGLLSGQLRILETLSGKRPVRAELQRPSAEGWQTLGTTHIGWAFPWRKTTRVIQNTQPL